MLRALELSQGMHLLITGSMTIRLLWIWRAKYLKF
uniref:Calcium ion binding protein, putative n=1 Tax=Arundo donax TaxID=35708 RepID=A0A0A9CW41_ARUDO